jgi:hypothetical protein
MPFAIISAGMGWLVFILGVQPQGNAHLIQCHVDPVGMNLNSCKHSAEHRTQLLGIEILPSGDELRRLV